MILRRVIAQFRKQEWTAIAIDFVIVVLGVFLGLQVSNWNAGRADRASERQYLGQLREDLRLRGDRPLVVTLHPSDREPPDAALLSAFERNVRKPPVPMSSFHEGQVVGTRGHSVGTVCGQNVDFCGHTVAAVGQNVGVGATAQTVG